MADKVTYPGRLIAIDGSRGKDVATAAESIAAELNGRGVECGISRWDASGLFSELAIADRESRSLSARTLSLVYAADLAFRLRWEIRPVLDSGGTVIAASYVDTAAAFGASCGLADEWLRELMRFAPAPHVRVRARERKIDRPWKHRLDRGYAEYAAVMLERNTTGHVSLKERRAMIEALDAARGRRVYHLATKSVSAVAAAATAPTRTARRRVRTRN